MFSYPHQIEKPIKFRILDWDHNNPAHATEVTEQEKKLLELINKHIGKKIELSAQQKQLYFLLLYLAKGEKKLRMSLTDIKKYWIKHGPNEWSPTAQYIKTYLTELQEKGLLKYCADITPKVVCPTCGHSKGGFNSGVIIDFLK